MKIKKPDNCILLQSYHVIDKQPMLFVSIGYVVDKDHNLLTEQQVWPWLLSYTDKEPVDLVLKKHHGTFAVLGSAYAPRQMPIKQMAVTVQLGALKKTVYVFGDRYWQQGLVGWTHSEPASFIEMPIDLTRAFGAPSYAKNPYGKGYIDSEPQVGGLLPNIELPNQLIHQPKQRPDIATFRALPVSSPDKQQWLGKVDALWQQQHFPWIPVDTDARWFDGVPTDQTQATYWQGGEPWSVTGMHAEHTEVQGILPLLRPRLLVRKSVKNTVEPDQILEPKLDLDTVWLFPNEQRVLLWFRAAIAVEREDAPEVRALCVATEYKNEIPQSVDQLVAQWTAIDITRDDEVSRDPLLSAEEQAAFTTQKAAFQQGLMADITAAFEESRQEVNAAFKKMKQEMGLEIDSVEPIVLTEKASPSHDEFDMTQSPEAFAQQLQDQINVELKQGRELAEQKVREAARQCGLDEQELVDMIWVVQPDGQDIDVEALLDQAPIDDSLRQIILSVMAQVQEQEKKIVQQVQSKFTQDDIAVAENLATEKNYKGICFTDDQVAQFDFTEALLEQCDFSGVNLTGVSFARASIRHCDFRQANLSNSIWQQADVIDTQFELANLSQADLNGVSMQRCQLTQVQMPHAQLQRAFFDECAFNQANLYQVAADSASFVNTQLKETIFSHASLVDLRMDNQCDATQALFIRADLCRASLQGSCFVAANLTEALMSDAFFNECILTQSIAKLAIAKQISISNSRLDQIQWPGINLMNATLSHCDMRLADLRGANLFGVEARTTQIETALVEGALIARTSFSILE